MTTVWLISLSAVSALLLLLLVGVFIAHRRLRADYLRLAEIVHRNSQDVAGLCTAALTVDEHIAMVEQQQYDLSEQIAQLQVAPQSTHAYSGDIQKVRSGASVHELMQSSGMSHDEAALLIHLHGNKTSG